jgi:hypothetical protein
MQIASVMADEVSTDSGEPAETKAPPVGKHNVAPDEELIKLRRSPPKIGLLTAAGVVFLAVFYLLRLNPDRKFAGNDDQPTPTTVADVASGRLDPESYVSMPAEPLMAHAVRAQTAKNSVGLRVVPVRGGANMVWVVLPGDGWAPETQGAYIGRLRKLSDLPFAGVLADFLTAHPRPLFAKAAAVRAGFASNQVATVAGDTITVRDNDRIGFDVTEPNAAVVVVTYNERFPNLAAWAKALADAGVTGVGPGRDDRERAFFDISMPGAVATIGTKLEAAGLWAARVDPVTHHHETTWRALKASGPTGFTVGGLTIPEAELDLIGMYVVRDVPSGAYAVIIGESPQDYWYVLPVAILVALIGLLFAWAFVRAVRREFPRRAAAA